MRLPMVDLLGSHQNNGESIAAKAARLGKDGAGSRPTTSSDASPVKRNDHGIMAG
jgi:hypothetical protein